MYRVSSCIESKKMLDSPFLCEKYRYTTAIRSYMYDECMYVCMCMYERSEHFGTNIRNMPLIPRANQGCIYINIIYSHSSLSFMRFDFSLWFSVRTNSFYRIVIDWRLQRIRLHDGYLPISAEKQPDACTNHPLPYFSVFNIMNTADIYCIANLYSYNFASLLILSRY